VEEDEEKRVEQWESEKMKNFRSKTFLHQNLKPEKTLFSCSIFMNLKNR
jgi:hypothetical protein